MTDNKARRRRGNVIQGGWATGDTRTKSTARKLKEPEVKIQTKDEQTASTSPSKGRFLFHQPEKDGDVSVQTKEKTITESGSYVISRVPSGISRIIFNESFLSPEKADETFSYLYKSIPWEQHKVKVEGNFIQQPRLVCWYSEVPYSFSGITMLPTDSVDWPPVLVEIRDMLQAQTGIRFNSILCNLYRDNHDSIGWHSDNEYGMGPCPTIASISLGDTRVFQLMRRTDAQKVDSYSESLVKVPLPHGSLLIMSDHVQDDWLHCVKKEYHDRGPRVNLTYRVMVTAPSQKTNAIDDEDDNDDR